MDVKVSFVDFVGFEKMKMLSRRSILLNAGKKKFSFDLFAEKINSH